MPVFLPRGSEPQPDSHADKSGSSKHEFCPLSAIRAGQMPFHSGLRAGPHCWSGSTGVGSKTLAGFHSGLRAGPHCWTRAVVNWKLPVRFHSGLRAGPHCWAYTPWHAAWFARVPLRSPCRTSLLGRQPHQRRLRHPAGSTPVFAPDLIAGDRYPQARSRPYRFHPVSVPDLIAGPSCTKSSPGTAHRSTPVSAPDLIAGFRRRRRTPTTRLLLRPPRRTSLLGPGRVIDRPAGTAFTPASAPDLIAGSPAPRPPR